jgi:GH15 family glucan-1,4-alpha-glucosidase
MAWLAFDQAVRAVEDGSHAGAVEHWCAVRDRIHREICESFNEQPNMFVQNYGADRIGAGGLVMLYRSESNVDGFPPGEAASRVPPATVRALEV